MVNIWGLAFNAQVYIMLAPDEKHGEKLTQSLLTNNALDSTT